VLQLRRLPLLLLPVVLLLPQVLVQHLPHWPLPPPLPLSQPARLRRRLPTLLLLQVLQQPLG
jgi:hypothetical protein